MKKKILAALAAVALLGGISAAPAEAAPRPARAYYADKYHDAKFGIDITGVTAGVRDGKFNLKIYGSEFIRTKLNVVDVYISSNWRNAGPEYRLSWGLPYDGVWNDRSDNAYDGNDFRAALGKVDTWDTAGRKVRCAKIRLDRNLATDVVTVQIPMRCMGSPEPRNMAWGVTTKKVTETDPDGSYWYWPDYFGGKHKMFSFPWDHI